MDISRLQDALAAYAETTKPVSSATEESPGGGTFKDLLTDTVTGTRDALKDGEINARAGAAGQADITDLVFSLNEAEMKLKTVVSLRDRLVASLQEIFRMPV